MEASIQIFNNPEFGEIRVAKTEDGEPIFCLADLCDALQLSNNRKVKSQLDDDVTLSYPIQDSLGREQQATFVTESGMYTVILRSDSPYAKPMQKWVTSEVLPSIRKSGGYMVAKQEDTPESIMARALLIANETMERQKAQLTEVKERNDRLTVRNLENIQKLEEQAPKVLFADTVTASDKSILMADLAKILKQKGVEIGQNRLYEWMRNHGYLCSKGQYYNRPTQKAMELCLFEVIERTISTPSKELTTFTTMITGKGQIYFVNKFLFNKSKDN